VLDERQQEAAMKDMAVLWENLKNKNADGDADGDGGGTVDQADFLRTVDPNGRMAESDPKLYKAIVSLHTALVHADSTNMLPLDIVIDTVRYQAALNSLMKKSLQSTARHIH
jgi:hypothetical protein